jgi:hypothetical protein
MLQHLKLFTIVLVVLGTGYWGYLQLFSEDTEVPGLVVLEVEGLVEFTRGEGEGQALEVGTQLSENDQLHVGSEGRAVLGIGEGTRLHVDPNSTVQVLGIDGDGIRLELEEGRIQAKVQPGNPSVEIAHGSKTARTELGGFTMSVSGNDDVLVQSQEGVVGLSGFEDLEELAEGHYVHASPGEPIISADEAKALLLHIQWPGEEVRREAGIELQGTTLPNARLQALRGDEQIELRADSEGNFQLELELEEGQNTVQFTATDPLGRSTDDQMTLTVDSTPPSAVETEIQWVEE